MGIPLFNLQPIRTKSLVAQLPAKQSVIAVQGTSVNDSIKVFIRPSLFAVT